MATRQASKGSNYRSSITREPFLFFEMRTTARLMISGLSDTEAIEKIVKENLFQYPTERSIKKIARACQRRLHKMKDESLVDAIATKSQNVAKQICLYAMMKDHQLINDFWLTVIGEKYRTQDMSFGRIDVNAFFMRLQEQDEAVAGWSEQTIQKLGQVIIKTLVENEYLDDTRSTRLNPVLICSILKNTLRVNEDSYMLPAFNCFS